MPQYSKLLISRDSWKEKATRRALENKELRKNDTYKTKQIFELRRQFKAMKTEAESLKKN
jgi:hypothetical protein